MDRQKRILIADDDSINQKVLAAHLKALGFEPQNMVFASDGKQAVAACFAERFQLVFMDIQMPLMDGMQAAGEILKLEDPPVIIAVTASDPGADEAIYLAAGMSQVLYKPVTQEKLKALLF